VHAQLAGGLVICQMGQEGICPDGMAAGLLLCACNVGGPEPYVGKWYMVNG
jgi:hypothetical protein